MTCRRVSRFGSFRIGAKIWRIVFAIRICGFELFAFVLMDRFAEVLILQICAFLIILSLGYIGSWGFDKLDYKQKKIGF